MTIRLGNRLVTLSAHTRYHVPAARRFAPTFAPDVAVCAGVVCALSAVLCSVLSLVNGGAL